jgi:integrase
MLATALEMNLIEYNPARRVPKPRVPHTTRRIFTVEEAKRYAEAIEGHPFQAAMLLALIHGMRLGEILALQWGDIDFERQTLTVQRSLTQGSDGRFYPGPTKTHRSSRPVQLADSVTAVLRQRKVIQNQERLKFGPGWEDNGGVFTRPDGRLLSKTNFGRAYHYRVIEENDLPRITFHDLRHCAASLGLMASINPKTIQEMLGHSSIAITLDIYSHVMPSTHREAGNAIAASVGL